GYDTIDICEYLEVSWRTFETESLDRFTIERDQKKHFGTNLENQIFAPLFDDGRATKAKGQLF
ncbi:MAG TPA: hypothetical protein VKC60_05360, partial [Opitutaceae bacterium]|nr:hypothetical protein [Opitutaceae bacterium]